MATVSIPVLANDYDVDGDEMRIISNMNPAHGSAIISGDQVIYTQTTAYEGSDTFSYTIADGHGGQDTATVTILVSPQRQYLPFLLSAQ